MKRSDSKNPNTTCRGVTGSGRPCRRPNTKADAPQPKTKSRKDRLRVLNDPSDPDAYCWQHKDQATASTNSSPGPQISNTPILEGRTSIDSLTGRLGLLNMSKPGRPSRPQQPSAQQSYNNGGYSNSEPQKPIKEWTFCCFRIPLYFDDPTPPPRPSATPMQQPSSMGRPSRPNSNNYLSPGSNSGRPNRPSFSSQTPSHISNASQHASYVPPDAPPETAKKLIAEMAKPFSKNDEEGYIYIFWLTPESQTSAPQTVNARSLLEPTVRSLEPPDSPARPRGADRRPSDVLASFAAAANSVGTWGSLTGTRSRAMGSGNDKPTMLLKIGRANNVMRRMNEWKRQCGYDLSLVRFYPYIQTGSGVEPHKMPHSHKVERLIHLELRGLGLGVSDRGECDACGRVHKEWFEIEATQEGVLRVDEAIRRWVDWDEGQVSA